ncbi:TonB-dependent receptor [Hymenobacter sp. 15J16-1T3B]|uniref:TonB-dependent receptor n=1 Tax=Hymenobacter sp. 15J16-1T3B TaxID=2886941 RepID=UPI001D0FDAE2|nr:TonB-dependent receptor [Hymenobacter sp. 15J16-1T3B]MCC3155804.1 TonB-dependent receptor [Hymenobacter sp. 15J16-1T3B]
MSRSLLLSACLLVPALAEAQSVPNPAPRAAAAVTVTGRVVDQSTQQPVPGVTLLFPDLKQGTATDTDGRFSFQNLPRGRFLVQIRSLGYGTLVRTVDTGSGQPLDFALSPAVTELGQVVVTGVSASTELRRSPVPTTVLDKDELNQHASSNVIDAIAHTPGVSQITTGAAISKPVIRGLSSNRVITLNNGAKQEGQQWGDEHGIEIDEYSIDRAEIIKGPGSLLYGSDGMAGVVNFVAPDPVDNGRVLGSVAANYQTNNHLQGYSLMNAGNLNGFNWLVRGSGKVAGDYRNRYDGQVYNSGFQELNGSGYVGLNKSWGYSHLTVSSFNQELGLIEGARDSATGRFVQEYAVGNDAVGNRLVDRDGFRGYGLDVPRQQINHLRIGTDNNFILGQSRLTVNVGWQQNLRREFGDVLAADEPSLYFQLRTLDYAARYFLPELGGWNTTVGVSGMRQENQNLGAEFLIPAYQLFDGGVFGVTKRTFGRLDVSGGLRLDQRRITADALWLNEQEEPVPGGTPNAEQKFAAFQNTYRNWSGSLGGAFSITDDLVLKANVSRGFRAPNIAELGSNGVHEGTTRYEIGNPGLQAETSLQSDLGLSLNTEHVTFSVDGFDNRIQHFIFPRRISNVAGGDSTRVNPEDGEEYRVFLYGQSPANLYGGEVTVDLHPHPLDWLHFENSFSMVRSRRLGQSEGEKWLPFTPADRVQSELRVNFRKVPGLSAVANVYARAGLEHNFAQRRIFGAFDTETPTDAYTLVNLGAGTDFVTSKGRTVASVLLSVNNVFDVAYQNHLSRLKYTDVNNVTGRQGVFNQGRNVSLKLLVPLSFN